MTPMAAIVAQSQAMRIRFAQLIHFIAHRFVERSIAVSQTGARFLGFREESFTAFGNGCAIVSFISEYPGKSRLKRPISRYTSGLLLWRAWPRPAR
jgi:hypothetical protein